MSAAKMRICFISLGTFRHIDPYLDYFSSVGHDVFFLPLTPGPSRDVPTYPLWIGGGYSASTGKWKYPVSMVKARYLIRRLRPDVVNAHFATSGGLTALVAGFHPTVVTVHGSDLTHRAKSRLWRPILSRILRFSDCVNTMSHELARIATDLGSDPVKQEVLTLGIDTEQFAFSPPVEHDASEGFRLICTRAMEPLYDHFTIIDAVTLLRDEAVRFSVTFVGSGSLRCALERKVAGSRLEDCIRFLGEVSNRGLPRILADHHAYVSSSTRDGASLSLLEAMATGLFPIVSRIKANEAWIDDGVSGLLYEVGDARGLADSILRAMREPELLAGAVFRNRDRVVDHGDRTTNMKRLEARFLELVAGRCS